jgi:hypothetical protein
MEFPPHPEGPQDSKVDGVKLPTPGRHSCCSGALTVSNWAIDLHGGL